MHPILLVHHLIEDSFTATDANGNSFCSFSAFLLTTLAARHDADSSKVIHFIVYNLCILTSLHTHKVKVLIVVGQQLPAQYIFCCEHSYGD